MSSPSDSPNLETETGTEAEPHDAALDPSSTNGEAPAIITEKVARAQDRLGHTFDDPTLLREALTHASHAEQRVDSNERMEFLGDAILGMVVCEHLYHRFPGLLEGEMTKIKSSVVSRRTCAAIAERLGLADTLRMGKGMSARVKLPHSVSAAAFESVVAAIYLDAGMDAARAFIIEHVAPFVEEAAISTHQSNYKSALQQFAQKHLTHHPTYVLVDEQGPDHAKAFAVAVEIAGQRFPACWAHAKKEAEQHAARAALEALGLLVQDDDGRPHLHTGPEAAEVADGLDFSI